MNLVDEDLDKMQHKIIGGCEFCSKLETQPDWEHDYTCPRRKEYNGFFNRMRDYRAFLECAMAYYE